MHEPNTLLVARLAQDNRSEGAVIDSPVSESTLDACTREKLLQANELWLVTDACGL